MAFRAVRVIEAEPCRNANSSNLITRVSGSNENYPPTTLPWECEKGSQRVILETHIPLATTVLCLHHGAPFSINFTLHEHCFFPPLASTLIALASCWWIFSLFFIVIQCYEHLRAKKGGAELSHWRAVIVFNWKLRWRTFQYVNLDGFGIGVWRAACVLARVARSSSLDEKVGGGDVALLRDDGNTTPRWVVVNFLEREEQKEEFSADSATNCFWQSPNRFRGRKINFAKVWDEQVSQREALLLAICHHSSEKLRSVNLQGSLHLREIWLQA